MTTESNVVDLRARSAQQRSGEPGFTAAVLLPDDDPGNACGFEQGLLWARLESQPVTWCGTYRTRNLNALRPIAEFHGYGIVVENTADPAWCYVDFARRGPSRLDASDPRSRMEKAERDLATARALLRERSIAGHLAGQWSGAVRTTRHAGEWDACSEPTCAADRAALGMEGA